MKPGKAAWKKISAISILAGLATAAPLPAQTPPTPQTVAVRAGRMFDPRSGTNVSNQVVLIKGNRITDVGPAGRVAIPAGARVIDLSHATVHPGLIDGHVHITDVEGGLQHQMMMALHSATQSMNAGFTTLVCMGSHGGGYADVKLRKAIESGLVRGPRLLTAGPVLQITTPGSTPFPLDFKPFAVDLVAGGPEAMRAAVRKLAHYGADLVKIYNTGPFYFKPDGEMVNQALFSLEEIKSVVDEAHRRGMFVASHTYEATT